MNADAPHRRLCMRLRLAAGGLLCASAAACVAPALSQPGAKSVNDAQKVAVELFSALSDAQQAAMDEAGRKALSSQLSARLGAARPMEAPDQASPTSLPPVLALGLPSQWPAERAAELPLLLGLRTTGLRDWQVNIQRNLQVCVTSLDTGHTWTHQLGGSPKRAHEPVPSAHGEPPAAGFAASHGSRVLRFSRLQGGMREPWPAGRYAVRVLNYDWVSNTRLLVLTGTPSAAGPAPRPAAPALSAERDDAPPGVGLRLQLPGQVKAGAALPVQVTLRLPVERVTMAPQAGAVQGAVLLGSLLLVRRDADLLQPLPLALPVRPVSSQGEVAKSLAFDARSVMPGALERGPHQAYLVFGEFVAGPVPFNVE